jgi:succinate-semialdehyde dehydrogenase / glutarate-semialdehyde dehydrogenase
VTTTTRIDPSGRTYRTLNPATGELLTEYPTATDDEAEGLLTRAHTAFTGWASTPVARRAELLARFADVAEKHADELAHQVSLEMGKLIGGAKWEAGSIADIFRYYARNGERFLADEVTQVQGFSHFVTRREPLGVVLGIEPWNAPLYQAARVAGPNLMLGNTVLLKPSEVSPGSTLLLDALFEEAGFPPDVYQTALVSTGQVSSYIADPRLRAVTLTGSDRAGSAIGEQAGRHIKPVVLELGGSDAFIVLESADVAKAAGTAVSCRLRVAGQVCVSPKRIILTEAIADEFVAQFAAAFASQTMGDPFDPRTTVGPLASAVAADLLQEQLQDAVDKGATVLVPGGRVDGPGAYFRPAVITGITPDMRVYTEEVFGPLAMIYRVADADAAVALANSSQFGLGGTVFGEDLDEARRVAGQHDIGMVGINAFLISPVELPFGGTRRSGVGRELGRNGMDQFANVKTYGTA